MFRLEFSLLGRTVRFESEKNDAHMKKNDQSGETGASRANTPGNVNQGEIKSSSLHMFEGESQAAKDLRAIRDTTNSFFALSGTGQQSKFSPR